MGAVPAAGMPAKRKTSIVVWILLAVGGLIVLGIAGVAFTAYYFVKNPGVALAKVITASNPDAEVISTDTDTQTVHVRDRRTGQEFSLSFDDIKNGRFKIRARGDNGEMADVEISAGTGKLPSWVPVYPGAKAQANITAKGSDANEGGEGGVVTLTTGDAPAQVFSFYQSKTKEMGLTATLTQVSDSGGMLMAADEAEQRSLQIVVAGGGETTVTLTYARKR